MIVDCNACLTSNLKSYPIKLRNHNTNNTDEKGSTLVAPTLQNPDIGLGTLNDW
jgi:hypothetical protein